MFYKDVSLNGPSIWNVLNTNNTRSKCTTHKIILPIIHIYNILFEHPMQTNITNDRQQRYATIIYPIWHPSTCMLKLNQNDYINIYMFVQLANYLITMITDDKWR